MAITTLSSTSTATFTASGLASGLDTSSIVDQLVALESKPIDLLKSQQTALKSQISTLGTVISKLSALATAAGDLGSNGVFATKVSSSNSAFSATGGSQTVPGRYSVEVQQMARAAKWRSDGFTSGQTMAGGQLQLTVQNKAYPPITIADGATLADVAYAIRSSGAPLSAVVLNDGTRSYLSVTAQDTGHPLGQAASTALQISLTAPVDGNGDPIPQNGAQPGFHLIDPAQNAIVVVDDLTFTRQSNLVTDAVPGATLTLNKQALGVPEELVIGTDSAGTQGRLQAFVDAYNGVMSVVQQQLAVSKATNRAVSLAGVSSVRSLQGQLQQLMVTKVPGIANVRTLADLGLKTSKDDASLSIDPDRLAKAIASDPGAVNALFSTAGTGIAKLVQNLVDRNTTSDTGALMLSRDTLSKRVTDLDDQIATMQSRVDAFRLGLLARFNAMETTISSLKTMGTFLTNWAAQNNKSS